VSTSAARATASSSFGAALDPTDALNAELYLHDHQTPDTW
jgi:hypothetical protein